MTKPFLKWVGGKGDIVDKLVKYFPKKIDIYYEPFIGGGSVALYLLSEKWEINKYVLSDINCSLITTYRTILNDVEWLISELKTLRKDMKDSDDPEEYYYQIRNKYNNTERDTKEIAPLFIFLNKTCFRGLYRENRDGEFNVPYGHYKNPKICDSNHLEEVNKLFSNNNIKFRQGTFADIELSKGDFVYFDPPYHPVDGSFVSYCGQWTAKNEKVLREMCDTLEESEIKFVQSNAKCKYMRDNYDTYTIKEIKCKRRINSKKPGSTCVEYLITNNSSNM